VPGIEFPPPREIISDEQQQAAIKLQSIARMKKERRQLQQLQAQREQKPELLELRRQRVNLREVVPGIEFPPPREIIPDEQQQAIIKIQSIARMKLTQKLLAQNEAAIKIQLQARQFLTNQQLKRVQELEERNNRVAIIIQKNIRGMIGREQLKNLQEAEKKANAIQNQIEELRKAREEAHVRYQIAKGDVPQRQINVIQEGAENSDFGTCVRCGGYTSFGRTPRRRRYNRRRH
jgi:hypothetical protein